MGDVPRFGKMSLFWPDTPDDGCGRPKPSIGWLIENGRRV